MKAAMILLALLGFSAAVPAQAQTSMAAALMTRRLATRISSSFIAGFLRPGWDQDSRALMAG